MNCDAVRHLASLGTKLIITADNGIVCFNEIELAYSLGMKVIITDHHLPLENLPACEAVVNPHRADCPSEFKAICGAQVAFRLICVMENKEPEELISRFADILSLAVISDIMPLTLENRSIVKCGIEMIKSSPLTGISALLQVSGIERGSINATKIAFGICPRINAAGRMGKAERAVKLLTTNDIMTALSIADEIDKENSARQQIEKEIYSKAVNIIEQKGYKHDRVIVVECENWHHGVIGIVASKITEKYGAPAILLSVNGEICSGSARSIIGFSIYDAIDSCRDLLLKFGGHSQAAGITLDTFKINEFRQRINEYANSLPFAIPTINLDCKLKPSALNLDLCFALKQLEPYGVGNPQPLFGVFGVKIERITPISNNKHLKILFSKENNTFQALLFGVTPQSFCFNVGDIVDLAVNVEANYYRESYSLSVFVKAIRMTDTDDDKIFFELDQFNKYSKGLPYNIECLLPTRQEVGQIYKTICLGAVLEERIKYLFMNSIGYAKTLIALETLKELGLIVQTDNALLKAVPNAPKTNLLDSITFKNLTERSGG